MPSRYVSQVRLNRQVTPTPALDTTTVLWGQGSHHLDLLPNSTHIFPCKVPIGTLFRNDLYPLAVDGEDDVERTFEGIPQKYRVNAVTVFSQPPTQKQIRRSTPYIELGKYALGFTRITHYAT